LLGRKEGTEKDESGWPKEAHDTNPYALAWSMAPLLSSLFYTTKDSRDFHFLSCIVVSPRTKREPERERVLGEKKKLANILYIEG
jgi:hypothetical protein